MGKIIIADNLEGGVDWVKVFTEDGRILHSDHHISIPQLVGILNSIGITVERHSVSDDDIYDWEPK